MTDSKPFIDNPINCSKVEIRDTGTIGRGVYAKEPIEAHTTIAEFVGPVYAAHEIDVFPLVVKDYCIQKSEREYIHAHGELAELVNHSCEPNCYIRGDGEIVTMRKLEADEQLFWHYATTEDSNWYCDCCCGTPSCPGKILPFRELTKEKQEFFLVNGYVAQWLADKYLDPLVQA